MRRYQQGILGPRIAILGAVGLVVLLSGCMQTGQGLGGMASLRSVPTRMGVGAPSRDASGFQPKPVEHQGALAPAQVADVLPGNTVIITQPWVALSRYELRETPIYFAADRRTFSRDWSGIPWSVRANEICMTRNQASKCYTAYSDATGQAYLRDQATGMLARVTSIEPGDSRRVQEAFQARLRQEEAKEGMLMMFAGLLFEGMLSGGMGGGGGAPQDRIIEIDQPASAPSGGGMSAPPISSFYGSCHSQMGC